MPHEIFISLTEHDKPIAEALGVAFGQVFGDGLVAHRDGQSGFVRLNQIWGV